MNIQEMGTASQYRLPVKVFILNNEWMGMVRQWQESFYDEHRSHSTFDDEPNFQLLAEAYAIDHYYFDKPATIKEDLKVILENKPMLIEVSISNREHVLPMVPAGKANHEMLGVKFNA